VTAATAADTLTVSFNDGAARDAVVKRWGSAIAAAIVEPLPGNMGVVPPVEGFLTRLVSTARSHGALVIFDEVMSGFRAALGGAQTLWGLDPDITLLGKVVGGGFALAAVIGKGEIMRHLAPSAGLSGRDASGNRGGCRGIQRSGPCRPGVFDSIAKTDTLTRIIDDARSADRSLGAVGTMTSFFFCEGPIRNFAEARAGRTFHRWFQNARSRDLWPLTLRDPLPFRGSQRP
jgi:glutamate-1-semialdehyde 2,1-aminomutase